MVSVDVPVIVSCPVETFWLVVGEVIFTATAGLNDCDGMQVTGPVVVVLQTVLVLREKIIVVIKRLKGTK